MHVNSVILDLPANLCSGLKARAPYAHEVERRMQL